MIKSDRFDTTGLLPDPTMDAPHERSQAEVARASYKRGDKPQNGNVRAGVAGHALTEDLMEHGTDGNVAQDTYMSRIDDLC